MSLSGSTASLGDDTFEPIFTMVIQNMLPLSGVKAGGPPTLGIYFYSTFFTSVWLWLYLLAGMSFKFVYFLGKGLDCIRHVLNIDEKPFGSLGVVATVFITVIYLVIGLYQIFL